MTARLCHACRSRTIDDQRFACHACVATFRDLLDDLPGRINALQAARRLQLKFTTTASYVTGGSTNQPLPFNPRAADLADHAMTTILHAARDTAAARGEHLTDWTWHAIQTYLDIRANWLAGTEHGATLIADLTHLNRKINHAIDRPRYRRIPIHIPCADHTTLPTGDRTQCPGEYYVLLDNHADWTQAIPDLTCDHDPTHRITPAEWQQAMRRAHTDPDRAHRFLTTLHDTTPA